MKNTILKIAGVKDEKSFYNKYPTEAAFLKAHPKAKAELKKFATGGQIGKNIGAGLYGIGEGLLDTITLGATDQFTDMGYKALQKAGGSTEDEIREQDSIHGFSQAAGAIGGAVINPAGTGAAIGQTGKGLGEGISRGNESEEWARTTGQALNAAGAIGSMAYGNFGSAGAAGAAGNASKLTGQSAKFAGSNFGKFAQNAGKYGSMAGQTAGILQPFFNQGRAMGGMQYAMGGEIQYANGGTGEINAEVEDNENAIGPNGEFTQFNGPTHAQGGIETDMAPGTMIFSDKLKMPGSKKSFAALNKLYDTNKEDNVLSSEKSNNTLKLTAMLMRDAKLKQSLALFQAQEQFKQDKVAAYAKRMGVQIPSQDNEQMEPQGMPEQSEGEMAMGGFNSYQDGGMKDYMPIIAEGAAEARQEYINKEKEKSMFQNLIESSAEARQELKNYKPNIYDFAERAAEGKEEFFQNNSYKPLPYLNFNFKDDQGRPVGPQNTFPQYQNQKYQVGGNTDPGKLSDIQRQLRVVKQQINVIQPDSQYVAGPLAKLRGLEKDLNIRQNNHPEFKKAMGGRLPMYQDEDYVDPNAGSPGGKGDGNGNGGFDWANAGKQAGQFALQNVGNLYDLGRSTQDDSKLSLSRITPSLLDKTQDLANNQRMYSEGKRQTAEASQGNASTYLSNMYANRASRLANDLNVNTTYGNLNSQIENSANLYNAGATDKETMFKLQSEAANRNLRGQALSGMGQNFMNQYVTNDKNSMDKKTLGLFTGQIKDPTLRKKLFEILNQKDPELGN